MVQNQISEQVKNSYESFDDQEIANMLDNELLTYSIEKRKSMRDILKKYNTFLRMLEEVKIELTNFCKRK